MGISIRKYTSSDLNQLTREANEFSKISESLINYGKVQKIIAVNPITREEIRAVAYNNNGNLEIKNSFNPNEDYPSSYIESHAGYTYGSIDSELRTKLDIGGGGGGVVYLEERYLYLYYSPEEACDGVNKGKEMIGPVYFYSKDNVYFKDPKGTNYFDGSDGKFYYFPVDNKNNPIEFSVQTISAKGLVTSNYICGLKEF